MLARKIFSNHVLKNLKLFARSIVHSKYPDLSIKKETIAEHIFSFCDKYSSNTAFIDDETKKSYTYSDVKTSMTAIASALTKRGVKKGTMVGIIATNSPEYLMIMFALSSMSCSVTICNQNFTEKELLYQLTDSQPSIIFTNKECLGKVKAVILQMSCIKEIYIIGEPLGGYGSVNELLNDSGNMSPIGQIDLDLDSHIALMPYSSGTTGLPKGVMLTHTNLVSNFHQINISHEIKGQKVMLIALPLYHIYAPTITVSMALFSGSSIVFQPKFDSVKFLKAIDNYKISVLHLVPPQILFFLNYPAVNNYKLSSIEKCFSAAAPLDAAIENRLNEKFRKHNQDFGIYQGYGLSETSPLTHICPTKGIPGKQGSIGLSVPSLKCKIVDIVSREEVFSNKSGELLLKGPNIMKGYFGKSSETLQAFEDGWFKTGDIAHYDDDEYFYISDRIKELIKVKGLQVAPAELEAVLLSLPGIADCAVIGVPDERCGEVPKAFIVKNGEVNETEIHDYMNNHLSSHKQLKGGIVFINEIPKSPSGKILRRLLK